jgi:hypothetical protein
VVSSKALLALGSYALTVTILGCSDSTGNSDVKPLKLETLVAGYLTTCGQDAAGGLFCWGATLNGFPAPDTTAPCKDYFLGCLMTPTAAPAPPDLRDITISSGFAHLCGIGSDDAMYCAGYMLVTYDALISLGSTLTKYGPSDPVVAIAAGSTHDCAITTMDQTWCWGDYDYNVRGTGGPVDHDYDFVPNPVAGGWDFSSIVSGATSSCGLLASGQALCWGDPLRVGVNNPPIRVNECGLPTECVDHPVVVNHNRAFTRLAAGIVTCGIDDLTDLYCWGPNTEGWVGDGTTTDRQEPVKINLPGSVVDVFVGTSSSCAIITSGAAYCWGNNHDRQLGAGSTEPYLATPTRLQISKPLSRIAIGWQHGCALDRDKAVWCWGANSQAELGVGDTLPRMKPVQVPRPD